MVVLFVGTRRDEQPKWRCLRLIGLNCSHHNTLTHMVSFTHVFVVASSCFSPCCCRSATFIVSKSENETLSSGYTRRGDGQQEEEEKALYPPKFRQTCKANNEEEIAFLFVEEVSYSCVLVITLSFPLLSTCLRFCCIFSRRSGCDAWGSSRELTDAFEGYWSGLYTLSSEKRGAT